MKKIILTIFIVGVAALAFCQQPFEQYGYKVKVATLSKGKYQEFFDQDSLIQIGTVVINTNSGRIVGFVTFDTTYSEATLNPELISRWISPDPLSDKYSSYSPYNFVLNNPIRYVDTDGKEPREGNEVLKVDFNRSFITHLYGYNENNRTYDQNLYSSATDYHLSNTMIDPGIVGTVGKFWRGVEKGYEMYSHGDDIMDLAGGAPSKSNNAYAWQSASMSKGGYSYLEITGKNTFTLRDVINQSSKLGKGFENTVTMKSNFTTNSEGQTKMTSMTFFKYFNSTNADGKKVVVTQSMTITIGADGKTSLKPSSSVQLAPPDKKKPNN
jgi:hypothetical protein